MNQIGFYHGIKKMSSMTNKSGVMNVFKEATRELGKYKNYVNQNLSSKNIILERNDNVLENQFANTIMTKTSKDIILVNSKIADGEVENKLKDDLTFFLTEVDWREYFKYDLEKVKEEMGKDAKCVYAVVHMDEAKPHLQAMFALQRKREKKALYTERDVDEEKIKANLKKDFNRHNKKNNITKNNLDKTKYKDWEDYRTQFYNEKLQKKIEFQLKKMNANTDTRDYEFPANADFRLVYENIHKNLYEKLKDNEIITRYKRNLEVMLGEKIDMVEKLENPLARGQNLRAVKVQVQKDKEKLIKDFLDNKVSKNQLIEKFYHDYNVLKKKEMTSDEFDEKMKRTQKLIKTRDRNRHFADTMLYFPKVIENVKNSGKIFLSKEDMKKLEAFLDKDEQKHGNLIERNQKINEANVKFKETQKELKEIKKIIADEEKVRENKRNTWKIEESEQENKRMDWKREETEHQKERENWNDEKNKIQQEKEKLKGENSQAKEELEDLKKKIKEKIGIVANIWKKDSKIQTEAQKVAKNELIEEYNQTYRNDPLIQNECRETVKQEYLKMYRNSQKIDDEVKEKVENEKRDEYEASFILEPKVIKELEEKVKNLKYNAMLNDEKYIKQAKAQLSKNKEFLKKVVVKIKEEKKKEIEENPEELEKLLTEIKIEYKSDDEKNRLISEKLKNDPYFREQTKISLKNDSAFRREIIENMTETEQEQIAVKTINLMNKEEKFSWIRDYVDEDRIMDTITDEELDQVEAETRNEILGEIKNKNESYYENILELPKLFFKYFKRFVERELSTTFEGSKYEKIYDKGMQSQSENIHKNLVKVLCKIVSFFYLKINEKKNIKEDIKSDLKVLQSDLKINDRNVQRYDMYR